MRAPACASSVRSICPRTRSASSSSPRRRAGTPNSRLSGPSWARFGSSKQSLPERRTPNENETETAPEIGSNQSRPAEKDGDQHRPRRAALGAHCNIPRGWGLHRASGATPGLRPGLEPLRGPGARRRANGDASGRGPTAPGVRAAPRDGAGRRIRRRQHDRRRSRPISGRPSVGTGVSVQTCCGGDGCARRARWDGDRAGADTGDCHEARWSPRGLPFAAATVEDGPSAVAAGVAAGAAAADAMLEERANDGRCIAVNCLHGRLGRR